MSKFNLAQTSFKRGYLSKRFAGATNLEEYFEGLEDINNFLPLPQGGLKKRNGTEHKRDWAITDDNPETYRPSLAYMYLDGGKSLILALYRNLIPDYIQAYSLAGDTVNISISADASVVLSTLLTLEYQVSRIGNILAIFPNVGIVQPILIRAEVVASVVNLTVDTWFDALFDEMPNTAFRTPYSTIIESNFSLAPSGTPGQGQITLAEDYFTAAMVGQYFRMIATIGASDSSSFVQIATVIDGKNATFFHVTQADLTAFTGTADELRKALWGPETGYPQIVSGFQQRTVLANTKADPDTIYGSSVRNRFFFLTKYLVEDKDAPITEIAEDYGLTSSVANTDPFVFNIASDYDTPISWLVGGNVLYIGKIDEERIATGYDDALGPLAVSIQKKSNVGGFRPYAVGIDQGVFFISGDTKSINYLTFNERNGASSAIGAESTALGMIEELGDTVTIKKIISMPGESLIVGLLSNGELATITYSPAINNFAWSKHQLAYEIIDMVYSAQDRKLYFMAKYPNTEVLTLESFEVESDFKGELEDTDNFFNPLDGANTSIIPTLSTITGLERYAEQEVTLISPEFGVETHTVDAGGNLTLTGEVSKYIVGQPISASLRSMRISGGTEYGQTNGRPKRVDSLVFDVLNSYGGRWTSVEGKPRYENLKYSAVEQFTGQIEIKPKTSYSDIPQIQIEHDAPYPLILLGITYKGVTYYD